MDMYILLHNTTLLLDDTENVDINHTTYALYQYIHVHIRASLASCIIIPTPYSVSYGVE